MNKKSASKTKSASKSSKPVSKGERLDVTENTSCTIRKIANGFIVNESGYTGKGRNQKWVSKEVFTPTNPVAGIKIGGSRKK